ncbi:immunoglobulin-like domain-containing protein [uncultured Cocleimonas sp.]|uniref:immunoglobulin-like domain-containing protein n=1 Tax=uncultured Cocleimonas sp. TaxID=1051587 RepID=UPI00261C29AA|nr:immunoglobulin-like domain-containing protein [uncultured Cocleimonas sp.]
MSKSVKFVKIVSPIALAIALTACGGGGSSFGDGDTSSSGDDSAIVIASSIELSVSSRQLASDGSSPITITAIAKDSNNTAIDAADITFAVDKDATILKDATVTTTVDPEDPTAEPVTTITAGSVQTATLKPGSATNQTLTVTASSGSTSKSITVEVVGTEVTIDGPQAITLNKDNPFVLKLKDSSNKAIAYEIVVLSSSAGNTIKTDSNFETDSAGEIAFTVTGDASGVDTITANVLGASFEKNIEVSSDEFALSSTSDEEININTNASIGFIWTKNGIAQSGKTITLSATRGDITSQTAVTDADGKANFSISSPTAGQTVITATTADGLSTTLDREFVATTPAYLNTQADPTLISPNGTSTIIAKVRDNNDNPVKNKIIDFRLNDTVDGVLSGSTAITDSLGRASVSYKAGNSSSAKDGVIIKTFIQGYPAVAEDEIKLTVGGNALRIVLGDDHLLEADDVFYNKKFGVIVTDSAGNPIKGQDVSFKIIPKYYYKGSLWDTGDGWSGQSVYDETGSVIYKGVTSVCLSEDFDNDGNLDSGEDINLNGTLEPTHDATVTGSGVTDENGKIVVETVYPKNTAWWSEQRIEATVTVDGTEFIEYTDFRLPVLAADVNSSDTTPPNLNSPYGTWGGCTDDPDGTPPPLPSADLSLLVVNPLTGAEVRELENNVWYSISGDGNILSASTYTLTSSVATIELGPNNSFRLQDNNTEVNNSGFYINLDLDGTGKIFFYRDNTAIIETDSTPPEIFISGNNPVAVTQGDVYVDAGATAIDLVDGPLTATAVLGLPVDTSVLGTHSIVYRATDRSGNIQQLIREVEVVAQDVPTIRLNDAVSQNNQFPDLVLNIGDLYVPNESAQDPTDGDITVVVSGDTVPVDGNNKVTNAGTYYVTYTAVDTDGNEAIATRTVIVNP